MTKLSTLAEAVASIPGEAHVALSGFAISRCAMAFAHEVIRQGITGLTVSQCVAAMDLDILVGGGAGGGAATESLSLLSRQPESARQVVATSNVSDLVCRVVIFRPGSSCPCPARGTKTRDVR